MTEDLQAVYDTCKTVVIDRELHRLNVDIAVLQETRLPESGSLKKKHYTFFWQGEGAAEIREHGVGFAVINTLPRMIEPKTGGTERLLTPRLSTANGLVNLVCVYAATLNSQGEVKDQFYESLDAVIGKVPFSEHI